MCSAELSEFCHNLSEVHRAAAQEILALNGGLRRSSECARQLSAAARRAAGSESAQRNQASIDLLEQVLENTNQLSRTMQACIEEMHSMLLTLHSAAACTRELEYLRSMLHYVSVLSSIEVSKASTSGVDMSSLAADVKALAVEMHRHLDCIADDLMQIKSLIEASTYPVDGGQSSDGKQSQLAVRAQQVLGPALARTHASQNAAGQIDAQYLAFQRSTDELVRSLQAEDATRQRLEHVEEVLKRVSGAIEAGEDPRSFTSILQLQRAQIEGARDGLVEAFTSVEHSLGTLEQHLDDLVGNVSALAAQSSEDGRLLAHSLSDGQGGLLDIFRQSDKDNQAMLRIIDRVTPAVEKIARAARSIESLQLDLRLLSLNAAIKAAQLGTGSAGIGVIAEHLQALARGSERKIHVILEGLLSIRQSLHQIETRRQSADLASLLSDAGGDALTQELGRLSASVSLSENETAAAFRDVSSLAETMRSELRKRAAVREQAEGIAAAFNRQIEKLDSIVAEQGPTGGAGAFSSSAAAGSVSANDLFLLYTMEAERKLHRLFFPGQLEAPSLSQTLPSSPPSEFGEDVELF